MVYVARTVVLSALIPTVATAGPPFIVDDPGTVDPGAGTLLVSYEYDRLDGAETHSLPAATLTLGFDHRLEFAIGGKVIKADDDLGPDDIELTPKWRFLEQDGAIPAVAAAYTLRLPTGTDPIAGDTTTHSPYLALGWQFDQRWQIFGQAGARLPDDDSERAQFQCGAAVGCQVTDSWLLGMDFLGTTRVSDDHAAGINLGIATQIDVSDSWTIMARVGHSIDGPDQTTAFVGLQLNF